MPNRQNKTPGTNRNTVGLEVRNLRISDYENLIKLWDEAKLPYKPNGRDKKENLARELMSDTAIFLIAEINGVLVGSVFGTHDGRKGWINRLAVAPVHRQKGLGAYLVQEVEKKLYRMGIEIIACLIEDWNTISIEAFQKMGYERHNDIIYLSKRKNADV